MKRFWAAVTTEPGSAGWSIFLDGRLVKTPMKAPLHLPTEALAQAVAAEWDAQDGELDPAAMPMTRHANTALDRVRGQEPVMADQVTAFARGETLCYRSDGPDVLRQRQEAVWDDPLCWVANRLGHSFTVTHAVLPVEQPPALLAAVSAYARGLDLYSLTALLQAAGLTKSFCLAMALVEQYLQPHQIHALAHLEELYQMEQWGRDDEQAARLDGLASELDQLYQFFSLATGLQPR